MTAEKLDVEFTPSEDRQALPASAGSDFGEEFWCRNHYAEASCPFCGTKGLEVDYSSYGTDLYCADGCHGRYVFPCAPFEAWRMWSIHQDKVRADIGIVISTARQNLPRAHGTIERIAEKYQENAIGEAQPPAKKL
jgi:hypothetical protein